jgi:hypothetical protein
MNYKFFLTLQTVSILLSSCYSTEKSYGVAYIRRNKSEFWEIQIPYKIKGRGSLHNFTFEKFRDSSQHYIVFSHYQRIIIADSVRLVYKKEYSAQSNLKGDITLTGSTLIVNFKLPTYNNKDEVKYWSKYQFNGFYKLISID